jgi:ribonuclease HI
MKYIIHTDGGSRGNPGNAAIGVVIEIAHDGTPASHGTPSLSQVTAFGKTIGVTTNNVAEYTAVIEALKWILEKHQKEIHQLQFYLDSTLVVNQLNGLFKVKDANMRMLMMKVRELEQEIGGRILYTYVPREQNSDADYQVNKALDELGN